MAHFLHLKKRISRHVYLLIAVLILIPLLSIIFFYWNSDYNELNYTIRTNQIGIFIGVIVLTGLVLVRMILGEINQAVHILHEYDAATARMGRILDQLFNEIYIFDAETLRFTQANKAALENSGYTLDELKGMTPVDIKPDFSAETFTELLTPLKNGELSVVHLVTTHERKNADTYPVEVRVQYFPDECPPVYVAVIEDITERQKSLEAIHANEAKNRFLSRISHELRTPLNAITGFAQLLQVTAQENLDEEQKNQVRYILQASWHLLELINRILDLSKIEADNIPFECEDVPLDEIIPESITMNQHLAEQRKIRIHCQPEKISIVAERTRLKQVLINLISNALKYNHEEGSVDVYCEQRPDGFIRICITDTGPGLSDEELGKIFHPFERLGKQHSGIEGSGMGLVVCKRVVERMNGKIGVDSKPGQGSCFWIELPRSDDNTSA